MNKHIPKNSTVDRKGERGAALVTTILISTMLLAITATVLLTSSMSATTAFDSTAELQAYYGAESGLEAALNVMRGHVAPSGGLPSGTRIGFRNALDRNTSNAVGDNSNDARLSGWLPYGNNQRVTPTGSTFAYSVILTDPDDPRREKLTADASYVPRRIAVQATGYGPRGAVKRMEMIIQKVTFDFNPNATITMRGSDSGSPMNFTIGDSAVKFYTGADNAGSGTHLPAFGTTSATDLGVANDSITKGATVQDQKTGLIENDSLPSFMQSADAARDFLNYMQGVSRSMGRYYTSYTGQAGSTSNPQLTFVNGNASLGPGNAGAGLLIVTGTLTLKGNPNFNGIILVLGEGVLVREGGGNGNILGSIYVAKFDRAWPSSENGQPHPFLAPSFYTNGAGNADVRYDSDWIQNAKNVLGTIVRDVREF